MIDYSPDEPCSKVLGNPLEGKDNVSQNLKLRYYPLGAFFINRVEPFMKSPSMYGRIWGAIELNPERHVDIDDPEELEAARRIYNRLARKTNIGT